MSNRGFDPSRVQGTKRDGPVIPQILAPETPHLAKGFTEIKVVGLGGAGNNTVDRMIETGVQGIDFIAVNSDIQALDHSLARKRLQVGERFTHGLGTGGDSRIGERSAEAAKEEIAMALDGADMVFITAGLGGGTGTGAAPVVAQVAQERGALTVGIVTLPFGFEGARRRSVALEGLDKLRPLLDSVIVIANDRLLQAMPASTKLPDAFRMADDTLNQGIHGIADLILTPGLINLDFADVSAIMHRSGPAIMGMGAGSGEGRALKAAQKAIASPLLEMSIDGARGVLLNVTGGPDLSLYEVNQAAEIISSVVAHDCNIILGLLFTRGFSMKSASL
ncbi:MAG: cell division protein FtsZ [Chloroflexota bacterium]